MTVISPWRLRGPALVILGTSLIVACSDSSGPGDTTVELNIDPVASPTKELRPVISGTTDPGSTVTVTTQRDSVSDLADVNGTFSLAARLLPDAISSVAVTAQDSAGNQAGDTFAVAHDGRVPIASFAAPLPGEVTSGQSGFTIAVGYVDQGTGELFVSGVDPATLTLESDGAVGGIFQPDGRTSTEYPAGTNLAPLFDRIGASEATLAVPESLAFAPGQRRLIARVRDLAGNSSPAEMVSLEVTPDPDRLVAVNASGAAGSSGNLVPIALLNADSVAGVQFDLLYDTFVIASVDAVQTADRATAFGGTDFNQIEPGRVRVLLFDVDGDIVPPGQGPVLNLSLTIQATAAPGSHTLVLTSVRVSDPTGDTFAAPDASGIFRVQ